MDIRLFGTMKEIKETVDFLNEHYTFFYDEEPRFRKLTPGLPPINERTEYIADLFSVMTRDEYTKLIKNEDS